jgi:hypothetical protein
MILFNDKYFFSQRRAILYLGIVTALFTNVQNAVANVSAKKRLKTEICFLGDSSQCFALSNEANTAQFFDTLEAVKEGRSISGKRIEPYISANVVRTIDEFKKKHKVNLPGYCKLVMTFNTHENEMLTNSEKYCVGKTHFYSLSGMLERILNSPEESRPKIASAETIKGLKRTRSKKVER